MSAPLVTVAIPVRDGAEVLERTLAAVRAQALEAEVELVVCDSGSRDASVALARAYEAEVIEIPAPSFSHGATRNRLMERSHGSHVAFLTQDAVPADERWLGRLIGGFGLAEAVGLVFGPYVPWPGASVMVTRELTAWFSSFAPDGRPRVDRLAPEERGVPARALLGPRGFFTDANGCVSRSAWEVAPFRDVPYAEDHVLAHDMLRAGFAKVYLPDAAVIHSHEYSAWNWLRRSFDEARALKDVYGWAEPLDARATTLKVWGRVGADRRWFVTRRGADSTSAAELTLLAASARHHALRVAGGVLGARAERLPRDLVRRLSLEGRER
jgi:glycosyltransferase involved in cell wall biosynthesis